MAKPWNGKLPEISRVLNLDWRLPWFKDWATTGQKLEQEWFQTGNLLAALNLSRMAPVQFVPQDQLPAGMAYEAYIFKTKQVPTRHNAHDFFNGLCWLRFPQTKLRLNSLQAQAIEEQGVQSHRGPLRDALTLLDENAALLLAPQELWKALQEKNWHAMFLDHRAAWTQTQLIVFGHAALEKLIKPYKGITVHVLNMPLPSRMNDTEIDSWLCQQLQAEWLQTKPYLPLPVMGLPAWSADNENPDFYEDKSVFRD
mgnify:CR=1 FL=1